MARKHITIRPRVNSALERVYDHRRADLAGLVHRLVEEDEIKQSQANKADGKEEE